MTSNNIMELASLTTLNQLTSSQASLLLLRILNTSDLTFFYMLLTDETRKDIAKVVQDLHRLEMVEDSSGLTQVQGDELNSLLNSILGEGR